MRAPLLPGKPVSIDATEPLDPPVLDPSVSELLVEGAMPRTDTVVTFLGCVVAFQHDLGKMAEQAATEHRLLTVARTMDDAGAIDEPEAYSQTLKALKRLTQEIDDRLVDLVQTLRQLDGARTATRAKAAQTGRALPAAAQALVVAAAP